ncbi:MAG: cytochrome c biogenesis protein [SAR202 cluster bacterium]|nr:cytochrome c biogenesis protein [SAR202 cluster bacterium]
MIRNALFVSSCVSTLVLIYLIFMWVPTERTLGISQRIFYVHVPIGWVGMVSIIVVGIASVVHLITRNNFWDAIAYSAAELGIIFATLILLTGAIWAKPAWGVWWTWDPKLTTTLILWFIYVGYLMVRSFSQGTRGRMYASAVALLGAIDAPIIYLASVWWRSAHPPLNIGPLAEQEMSLDSKMLITLFVAIITFTIFYVYLMVERFSFRRVEDKLDEVHQYVSVNL